MKVSRDAARRFLVRRQGLSSPRSLPAEPASVLRVVDALGSLQFDPLEAPGARNHDLVLHARIDRYERGWCEQWLYGPERRLFEAYNKSLNILPIAELPVHRFAWDRAEARHAVGLFKKRPSLITAVMERLRAQGVTGTREVTRHHDAAMDWYWAPTSEGRAALEALFETGRVAIARRDGNRRHYDLAERLLPAEHLAPRWSRAEMLRARLLSRHRAVGLLGANGQAEVFVAAGTAVERNAALRSLVDDGTLVPVEVEGVRGVRHVLASERAWLDQPNAHAGAVTLVAPLDPLMWDRRLVRELFGFDYRWEVYTPVEKRAFGYYTLPLLWGDRLVGRVEPRFDRRASALRIHGLWLDADVARDDAFAAAFREALRAFAAFVGAATVKFPATKQGRAWRDRYAPTA